MKVERIDELQIPVGMMAEPLDQAYQSIRSAI